MSMLYAISFRSEARDELLAAIDYIAAQASSERAERWYQGFSEALELLKEMPAHCALAREAARFPGIELRQLVYKSHRLLFVVRGDVVHILHVRHTAQEDLDVLREGL